MLIDSIKKKVAGSRITENFLNKGERGENFVLKGVCGSLNSILISLLYERIGGNFVIFVPEKDSALSLRDDLENLTDIDISVFISYDPYFFTDAVQNQEIISQRLKVYEKLFYNREGIFIIDSSSLIYPLKPPSELSNYFFEFKLGGQVEYDILLERIYNMGFERQIMVEEPGDFSVRGGIIDIFPHTFDNPLRMELDGNLIYSIRLFDVSTQRSIKNLDSTLFISPVNDLSGEDERIDKKSGFQFFDFLGEDIRFFKIEPFLYKNRMENHIKEIINNLPFDSYELFLDSSLEDNFYKPDEIITRMNSLPSIDISFETVYGKDEIDFSSCEPPSFKRDLSLLSKEISRLYSRENKCSVYILCDNNGQTERLEEFFEDDPNIVEEPFVGTGSLCEGFIFPDAGCAVFIDHQIFQREKWRPARRIRESVRGLFSDKSLSTGDFIVHEDYGIGKYFGLKKINVGGSLQECLKIMYEDKDYLYLNIDRLNKIEKYSAQEGIKPKLSKLGTTDWEKIKRKTKRSVQNIAKELLGIYAERKIKTGFSFSSDTQWQRELEASFFYEETPGQLQACREIKFDMEKPLIMDRLVCGDVGYGKTEVALRAAFKAVNDSKQVAVLVPTTILAQQHYDTFKSRLSKYPMGIEMLSRFRTRKQQKYIVERMKSGIVDIVIGTHRILSKDVEFKELGLLIIDEEQRFGVSHKEKLKKFRKEVDVLTMTATPIPRTLNMSLMGIRDLSNIDTPPKERLSIITKIIKFDDNIIRNAILREIDRGGQIYFVHNRVKTIDGIAARIKRIVPGLRVAIAHGQMKEKDLETIMIDFLERKFDCLVSTMIIESGLDMPNVNTIIIDRADKFGLSQLYQLRGRVGRSNVQAYSYLVVPSIDTLDDISLKRLLTIKSHSELGSGFKIALKDLEIRGAGNLLGREQSGFINAVGFDLYNKILQQTVNELKKKEFEIEEAEEVSDKDWELKIISDIDAFFPEDYINDSEQRVNYYRRLSGAKELNEVLDIEEEIKDRYGKFPDTVFNLMQLICIKILGNKLNINQISISNESLTAEFSEDIKNERFKEKIFSFSKFAPEEFTFFQGKKFGFRIMFQEKDDTKKLDNIRNLFENVLSQVITVEKKNIIEN